MKKTGVLTLIILCIIIALSCCPEKVKEEVSNQPVDISAVFENLNGILVADTIIYDVIIKNPNPDDKWTDACLKNLNKEQFVNLLFESVYNEQATAYEIFSDKIITPNELRKLEKNKDFDREKIGKIQFTESWFYNDSLRSMSKKIISFSLGYEILDERGNLIGHKPAFKIYLN